MYRRLAQSAIYFLHVILHLGAFWVMFAVAIPKQLSTQEHIVELWSYPPGRHVILTNTAFLVGNLLFALVVFCYVDKSRLIAALFSTAAWALAAAAYQFGAAGAIDNYVLGAAVITLFCIANPKRKNNDQRLPTEQ